MLHIETLARRIYKNKKLDTTSKINRYLNKYYKDLNDFEIRFIHEYCAYGCIPADKYPS